MFINSLAFEDVLQSDTGAPPQWYALQVRARSEQMIAQVLAAKSFECDVPCWAERRTYSDRTIRALVPAFSGYIFCRFDLAHRLRILNTPGVQCIVGIAGTPQAIEDDVVLALRKAFSCDRPISPADYLQAGDAVRVVRGPLAGTTGLLIRVKGETRLVISVHLLQRSVAVEVDSDAIDFRRQSTLAA